MPRANETQKAERLNRARDLLRHVDQFSDAVAQLGPGLLYFATSSLSLPRTSAAAETSGPTERGQTAIHRQTSAQSGPARPHVCSGQRIVHQRGGQPSIARAAAARARAWVSRNQVGNAPCSWSIDSIAYSQTSSLTCTSCSCRIGISQSEEKVRKQGIQPRE
jgi:hypothetical protein